MVSLTVHNLRTLTNMEEISATPCTSVFSLGIPFLKWDALIHTLTLNRRSSLF